MEVRFTYNSLVELKKLRKRYRNISKDIEPIVTALQGSHLIGDRIKNISNLQFIRRELKIAQQKKGNLVATESYIISKWKIVSIFYLFTLNLIVQTFQMKQSTML